MIKIYDTNYKFLKLLPTCRNAYTVETLSTGQKTLCFQVPCEEANFKIIQEEHYAETQDYSFIIKEILIEDNDYMEVHCVANLEDIKGKAFPIFDCLNYNLPQIYSYCLSKTDWTMEYLSKDFSIATYQLSNTNGYDMIKQVAEEHSQEYWFDTKNRKLIIYDKMGSDFGAYYSNELKLRQLIKQSSSYDYATVLYPYGKNGLTIGIVNNGKNYLENFSYSNKYIEKYFIDEDITVAEILKQKAEEYLAEICVPKASYKLQLSSLGPDLKLGDSIQLVDKIKQIKQKQRVVKITRYIWEPERDSVEISNLQEDFARKFVQSQDSIKKDIELIKSKLSKLNI